MCDKGKERFNPVKDHAQMSCVVIVLFLLCMKDKFFLILCCFKRDLPILVSYCDNNLNSNIHAGTGEKRLPLQFNL